MPGSVSGTFTWTPAIGREAVRFATPALRRMGLRFLAGVYVFVVLAFCAFLLSGTIRLSELNFSGWSLAYSFSVPAVLVYAWWHQRRQIEAAPINGRRVHFVLSPQVLRWDVEGLASVEWLRESMRERTVRPEGILVRSTGNASMWLPRDAFVTDDDWNRAARIAMGNAEGHIPSRLG